MRGHLAGSRFNVGSRGSISDFGFSILDCVRKLFGVEAPMQNPKSKIQNRIAAVAALFLIGSVVSFAQEEPRPDSEKPAEKKGGTLRARPDEDPSAAEFIAKLAPVRPQMAGV